ncbi:MAG: branched-chain amino acid ABC transporter permease [Candidatus Portnoybacteria bacterium CG11_big_fil_rev_8_21_14_0_20_44_10]|uniref:Branched-chain amino acid ABC transporter permease n=1 Tax=Candidatus Portnoybacteria bacterium CG11_big_fil_rev_8_21_14_0_20_44_10 TaxID=1974818 RepID=A0A2H0KRB3_9BACT|nr:MAG: branched-chain amino acid ABC transporter permease [Candidatus Portnoybacteria bacterium CG11_big_fil_rev_8_21_14_0_20_44_10]
MDIIPQLILNSIIAGAIYTLVALGFNLIYGATKFFNLAHGVMAAVGGYVFFYLAKTLGLNIFIAVIIGVGLAGLVGYGLDKLIYLPLRKRKASNMVLLVASLGAFTAPQAVIAILFTSQFKTLSQHVGTQKLFEVFGGFITQTQLIILTSVVLITAGLVLLLHKTQFGKAVRAISDDEEVAKIIGINTNKIIGYVFFIGSAIAGLAGILVGFDTGIEPTMGLSLLLKGVIASIVGGVGNIYGGVLGAFLLGFVENFGIWKISGEWKDAIAFALLIVFLIFRPRGIMNK